MRPRIPIGLLLVVALIGILVLVAMIGWLAWQFTLLDPTVAGALRVALFVALYGVPTAGAAVGLITLYNRYGKPETIRADKVIGMQRATVQRFPGSLTSLSYHDSSKALPAPPAAITAPLTPAMPGPLDLATLDVRPSESRILLALDAHGPVHVSVQQLCHVALLGATGGGKSNLLRLIIPQIQAFGASVCLADPHFAPVDPESGDDWRLIEQRLRFAPAVTAHQIDQLLDFMTEELDRRLALRRANQRVGVPMFLAFDELPSIADLVPSAVPRIGRLLREGRKVHLLTIGASQSMLIKEVGGSSALRDQYRTAAYVGGDRKSAAAILDMPERTIDDGPLGKGVILLRSEVTKPARLVRVPLVSNAAIAALLESAAAPETLDESATVKGLSFDFRPPVRTAPNESRMKVEESRLERGESRIAESPQDARVLALFRQGKSIGEIVKDLTGATSGATYNKTRSAVEETIRRATQGA
jgi:hypothetical protein